MSETRIDPELRELLSELARDPKAKLLRVQRVPFDLGSATAVSSREALLNAAERQLLAAYRSETAKLLRDASRNALLAAKDPEQIQTRLHPVGQGLESPHWERVRDGARRLERHRPIDSIGDSELQLLRACSSAPSSVLSLGTRLALAAARIESTPFAKIEAALALHLDGRRTQAREVLHRVLESRPDPLGRSLALENRACIDWQEARFEQALEGYGLAAETLPSRLAPAVARLMVSLCLEFPGESTTAARWLDDIAEPGHPFLNHLPRTKVLGRPAPPTPRASFADIANGFGPAARQVSDALFSP